MGDYAPATVVLYAVPDEHRRTVHSLLVDEWGLLFDWSEPPPRDELWLNYVYGDPEARLSISQDLVTALVDLDVTFTLHTDAKFEWDGDLSINVPGLGLFTSTCSQDGEVFVTAGEVDEAIRNTTAVQGTIDSANLRDLIDVLNGITGKAWRDAIAKLTPDPDKPIVLPL